MDKTRRVVATGLGTLAPNGMSTSSFWDALRAGVSGVAPIQRFDTSEFRVRIGAELKGFDPEDFGMTKKEARRTDPFTQYAVCAANMAVEDSGLDIGSEDPDRVGVIFGSGIGGILSLEDQHTILMEKGPRRVSPHFIPMMIADMTSGQVSISLGVRGPNYTTVSACSSGAHAIGNAYREIRDGEADIMITGGAEAAVSRLSLSGFANMKALSTRNDEPELASRPFDAERDGFVLGEGGRRDRAGGTRARGCKECFDLWRDGQCGLHRRRLPPNGYGTGRSGRGAGHGACATECGTESGGCGLYQRARDLYGYRRQE